MEKKELTCIICPIGCKMDVTVNGDEISVTGNTCKRGVEYAKSEMLHPVRTLTTTVYVENRKTVLPVKAIGLSKSKLFEAMDTVSKISVDAPIKSGDVIIEKLCGEVPLVATGSVL